MYSLALIYFQTCKCMDISYMWLGNPYFLEQLSLQCTKFQVNAFCLPYANSVDRQHQSILFMMILLTDNIKILLKSCVSLLTSFKDFIFLVVHGIIRRKHNRHNGYLNTEIKLSSQWLVYSILKTFDKLGIRGIMCTPPLPHFSNVIFCYDITNKNQFYLKLCKNLYT